MIAARPRKPSISAWGFTSTAATYTGSTAAQSPRMARYATSISSRQSTLSTWHQAAPLMTMAGLKASSIAAITEVRRSSFSRRAIW